MREAARLSFLFVRVLSWRLNKDSFLVIFASQYDSAKTGYQSNTSAGIFSMPPGAASGQSAAGMASYGIPGAHSQAAMMMSSLPPPQGTGQPMHSHQGSSYGHHGMLDAGASHMATGPGQSSRGTGVALHGTQQSKHHQLGSKQFTGWQQ